MTQSKNTIEKFLETFTGNGLENFDTIKSIQIIKSITNKIPADGEYDSAIIGDRIGEYIYAIQECGKLLASLGLVEAYQETEVEKEQAQAALVRAVDKGYTTAGERKLYAQMDPDYILAKNKLSEIQAVIAYIENSESSLDKAQLHCKKVIDHNHVQKRFSGDHERYSGSTDVSWISDEETLKIK